MKAILKFDLDDADDTRAHLRCVKSTDMALVLWEMVNNGRRKFEHMQEEGANFTGEEMLELVFKHFNELMEEHDISINQLIV